MNPFTALRRTLREKIKPIQLPQFSSCAMMLKLDFGLALEAEAIERAVNGVLEDGWRTFDIDENDKPYIGTAEMGRLIADCIK